jgi:hypothetical protein
MSKEIWGVYFSSDFQSSGTGVAIIDGNLVAGGTSAYYFTGKCDFDADLIFAKMNIKKFAPGKTVLNEFINEYTLILTGNRNDGMIVADGYIEERPALKMSCRMKKLCGL